MWRAVGVVSQDRGALRLSHVPVYGHKICALLVCFYTSTFDLHHTSCSPRLFPRQLHYFRVVYPSYMTFDKNTRDEYVLLLAVFVSSNDSPNLNHSYLSDLVFSLPVH